MSYNRATAIAPRWEQGQYLKYYDRIYIKTWNNFGCALRATIKAIIVCYPSTVIHELNLVIDNLMVHEEDFLNTAQKRSNAKMGRTTTAAIEKLTP